MNPLLALLPAILAAIGLVVALSEAASGEPAHTLHVSFLIGRRPFALCFPQGLPQAEDKGHG